MTKIKYDDNTVPCSIYNISYNNGRLKYDNYGSNKLNGKFA